MPKLVKTENKPTEEAKLLKKKKKGEIDLSRFQRVSAKDKIVFTQNLQVMLKTGLSLAAALKTLADQAEKEKFGNIIKAVQKRVEAGTPLATALKEHPKAFSDLFVSMIESGELSGNLDEVLGYLYMQMKKDHELVAKVRGAMIYPSVVVLAMGGIGTGMMIFVIPRLVSTFAEFQAELPLPTKILIAVSNFITGQGIILALLLILAIIIIRYWHKKTSGRKFFHKLYLKLPILAPISRKINVARFARTFSSLIKTDIPVIRSFEITSRTVGNYFYQAALKQAADDVKKGEPISQSLAKFARLFPPMVIQMITVGEQAGEVDEVLNETANFYEEDVDQIMKNLPQIIEPVLILVLGAGVGAMAVSIIMPLYTITQSI